MATNSEPTLAAARSADPFGTLPWVSTLAVAVSVAVIVRSLPR